jgi:hypothetical protein
MQTYRIYFMCGKSIIAAEMVEARGHADAANLAAAAVNPWRKFNPDRFEVWQGATFHHQGAV